MTTTATMPLRIWPGCLSCYNAGRLVGAWIDAADADEMTIAELHRQADAPLSPDCEEIWVLRASPGDSQSRHRASPHK